MLSSNQQSLLQSHRCWWIAGQRIRRARLERQNPLLERREDLALDGDQLELIRNQRYQRRQPIR